MRYTDLLERNNGLMRHFQQMFPNTPEYVLKDFVYKNYKNTPNQIEPEIVEWLNELTWTKKEMVIKIEVFDDFTQGRLRELIGEVPDEERYKTQRDRIASGANVNSEPIIVTVDGDELELQEGWHRTAESIRKWPDGYKQVVWIGS